jgi:hypothetical protein
VDRTGSHSGLTAHLVRNLPRSGQGGTDRNW